MRPATDDFEKLLEETIHDLPDQIFIFRQPLRRMFPNPEELREQIRITLIHELAHYFGCDDDCLQKLGLD